MLSDPIETASAQDMELLMRHVRSLQSERDALARHNAELSATLTILRVPAQTVSSGSLDEDMETATPESRAWEMRGRVNALVHAISSTCSLDDAPAMQLVDASPEELSRWAVQSIRTAMADAERTVFHAKLQGVTRYMSGDSACNRIRAREAFAKDLANAQRAVNDLHSSFLEASASAHL